MKALDKKKGFAYWARDVLETLTICFVIGCAFVLFTDGLDGVFASIVSITEKSVAVTAVLYVLFIIGNSVKEAEKK